MTNLLATYESIVQVSGHMAAAARDHDWDRLVSLEQDCAELVRHLQQAPARLGEPAEQKRKAALIHQVLDNDAEIRTHVEPWMEQVRHFLGDRHRGRAVNRAYGVGA